MIATAFLLGLMGSLHCLGMCGPIALMLPVNRNNWLKGMLQVGSYHLGRLLSYGSIGLLFGLFGKGLALFGIQQKLSVVIGILMIFAVLFPSWKVPGRSLLTPFHSFAGKIKNSLSKELRRKGADTFLAIGFLNGLLPCGLVYMAALGAIAMATARDGAIFMALFGLGTAPVMTAAVYLGNFANPTLRSRIRGFVPYLLAGIGILFILRGLGLGIPYISPVYVQNLGASSLECMSLK
jgi:sulfite exporter TauE/SafE